MPQNTTTACSTVPASNSDAARNGYLRLELVGLDMQKIANIQRELVKTVEDADMLHALRLRVEACEQGEFEAVSSLCINDN